MRHFGMTMAALLAVLAPGAAMASVISESVPINIVGSGLYEGSIDVPLGQFNSSLGTLTSESLTLLATFTPGFQWPCCMLPLPPGETYPASVPVTLTGRVGLADGRPVETTVFLDTVQAVRTGYDYVAVGTPQSFTVADDLQPIDFDSRVVTLEAWTEPSNDSQVPGGGSGDPADLTQVQGTLYVTYTYTPVRSAPLPEPASVALLSLGVLGISMVRWRG